MVHSTFSVRIKQQDQIPILVNDSLEENIIASEIVQIEGENYNKCETSTLNNIKDRNVNDMINFYSINRAFKIKWT